MREYKKVTAYVNAGKLHRDLTEILIIERPGAEGFRLLRN